MMETIRGKHARSLDTTALAARLAVYETVHIDIGTGDGRYVRHIAEANRRDFAIGVDACRENLHDTSRRAPENALFVIASAQTLPAALYGTASHLTVNFPWGSLLNSLLDGDPALLTGLRGIARVNATLDVRLNGGALAEAGWPLDGGAAQIREVLVSAGFAMQRPSAVCGRDLRAIPTTWAKRLAFGRDPRAVHLRGSMI